MVVNEMLFRGAYAKKSGLNVIICMSFVVKEELRGLHIAKFMKQLDTIRTQRKKQAIYLLQK